MSVDSLKILVFVLMTFVAVAGFLSWSAFLKVLKEEHPESFRSVDKPEAVASGGFGSDKAAFRFLYSSLYRGLENPKLDAFATRTKLCTAAIIGLMITLGYLDWVLG